MPACYAHYRFGVQMMDKMPGDIRRTVKRFRRLFDVGLHGPDPFFYYNPMKNNRIGELGSQLHRQTGQEFFTRVCRTVRLNPSEPALSYLYGVLTHYTLDSVCHPYINAWDREGPANHTEIEGEFERFLLELDGKTPPEEQDVSRHIYLTPGETQTMAMFYPGVSRKQADQSVKNMARITKMLVIPQGARRSVMEKTLQKVSRSYAGLLIPTRPNPTCSSLDAPLLEHYKEAQELFPRHLDGLTAHLTYNAPLGDEFEADFG